MGCDVDVKLPDVQNEIKSWGRWYYDHVGFDGVRFDAVKHVEARFFPKWLRHVRQHAKQRIFAVGEYWSYSVDALHAFVEATDGDVHLFDAPLLRNFSNASRSGNGYDLRQIFDNTLVRHRPTLAVTIVGNHDTQPLQALENVVEAWFTPIACAMILLRRDGYPAFVPHDGRLGVHTFRMVNAKGQSKFVKFHCVRIAAVQTCGNRDRPRTRGLDDR